MYASINGSLIKSWAASPSKFQWKNFKQDCFFGHGLVSVSTDIINNIILKYSLWKRIFRYKEKSSKIRAKMKILEGKITSFCSLCMILCVVNKSFLFQNVLCYNEPTKCIQRLLTFLWWRILSRECPN